MEAHKKRRILLAEDNMDLAELIQKELEFLGYEVRIASDGLEAVEITTSELPDLVVMDIRLPKLHGLEAIGRIQQNPKARDIPILAATALAMPGDREKCLACGCDDYIAKPFTVRELETTVKRLLKE
jgi:CheY-like chemotaxis protein